MTSPASLSHRVTLQQPLPVESAYGHDRQVWTDVATLWADVRPLRTGERLVAQGQGSRAEYEVVIRWRAGVLPSWRFVWAAPGGVSVPLEIHGDGLPDGRRRWLRYQCATGERAALDAVGSVVDGSDELVVPDGAEYVVPEGAEISTEDVTP